MLPAGAAPAKPDDQSQAEVELHYPQANRGQVAPPGIQGEAAVLVDADSGQVLCSLQAHQRMYPASLTKLLTAVIVAEHCRPQDVVTISPEASAVGETSLYLREGQQVTVRDLMAGAILKSANDAAAALAVHVGGSLAGFAEMMKDQARESGLCHSHFLNPHGLHEAQHYSTAADVAVLARSFLHYPWLRELAAQPTASLSSLLPEQQPTIRNQNRLLGRWQECTGLKSGYTRQAGNCIAASACRGGWDLVCVVLKSADVWTDAQSLLVWGFDNFCRVVPASSAGGRCQVRVSRGEQEYVGAALAWPATLILPRGRQNWQLEMHAQEQTAPVAAGQRVGYAVISVDGQARERIPLVAATAVARGGFLLDAPRGLLVTLSLLGVVVLYGAAAKTISARRRRLPAGQRRADRPGKGNRGRPGGHRPLPQGGPAAQPGARHRPDRAPAEQVHLCDAQQVRGVSVRQEG